MAGEVNTYLEALKSNNSDNNSNNNYEALGKLLAGYDASGDYWRLLDDGSLENDGDGWLRDVNNNYILDEKGNRIGAAGIEAGLINIFGMSDTVENRSKVIAMMQRANMTEKGNGIWWNHIGNIGKTISISDEQYRGIYEKRLAQQNPVNIYNTLVASGKMDLNPNYKENTSSWWYKGLNAVGLGGIAESIAGNKYISYEQYKANNFIQGMPELSIRAPIVEGSEISTLFGAIGNASTYSHRGIDFAVNGVSVYPIYTNDTTIANVFNSNDSLLSPQGRHVDLITDVTYTFKGEQRTDQIMQRMLHMDSIAVGRLDNVTIYTLLGVSGNTGTWNGSGYPYHFHTDLSTNQNRSPWLDQLGRNYVSQIMSSYSYPGDNRVYYDPLIFLHTYNYPVRDNANQYNR
jgi:murein DD-endopeptidase MepM/ murein hydrolase activator NlpD